MDICVVFLCIKISFISLGLGESLINCICNCADAKPDASGSYAEQNRDHALEVIFPEALLEKLPEDKRQAAIDCLKDDPRPSYHDDDRVYNMLFADCDIRFKVDGNTLTVFEVEKQ